ncbi:MAG: serine/threonine protein kinase [Chthoniobacterales bacterium]|nr:serine/threonine protein kinase [Chthoniobacterales bacterium]
MQAEKDLRLAQRYTIERSLGSGGLGEVFLAYDTCLDRWVALKRLRADLTGTVSAAEQMIREARALAALQHGNVVTVYDCFLEDDQPWLVMEFVPGQTLDKILMESPLSYDDFLDVAKQCLEGLAAAHARGLLHRDLKPSNIIVAKDSHGRKVVKILDFGLAKLCPRPMEQSTDQSGALFGSIHTMAPEQFEQHELDARTDLYALGCVLYECLAGRPPFDGQSPAEVMAAHLQHNYQPLAQLRPDIPQPICTWVERLFARLPSERPANSRQALGILQAIMRSSTSAVYPSKGQKNGIGKSVWHIGAVGVGLLVIAAIGLGYAFLQRPNVEGSKKSQLFDQKGSSEVFSGKSVPNASEVDLETSKFMPNETKRLLEMVGRRVVVEGKIVNIGQSRSGNVLYANFDGNQRGDLALVLFTTAEEKEKELEKLGNLVGKIVRVEGIVETFRGAPQIRLSPPTNLRVVSN